MVLTDLIGKTVIYKGNECPVLAVDTVKAGIIVLQLKAVATKKTKENQWVDIDETRIDVYFTSRPRLFGIMVDAYDGYAKVEWKDADGTVVPFRIDSKTNQYILDSENRPIMTMKVFDSKINEISLY